MGILTLHMSLDIPPGNNTWIDVAGTFRPWKAGKCLVFDSSFRHRTQNGAEEHRDVVIVDFWHPELTQDEIDGITWLYRFRYDFLTRARAPMWDIVRRMRRLSEP